VRTTQERCNVRTARSWVKRATFALRTALSATGYIVRELEGSRQKCLTGIYSLITKRRTSHKTVYSKTSSHLKSFLTRTQPLGISTRFPHSHTPGPSDPYIHCRRGEKCRKPSNFQTIRRMAYHAQSKSLSTGTKLRS
jgi:hypothetical protein